MPFKECDAGGLDVVDLPAIEYFVLNAKSWLRAIIICFYWNFSAVSVGKGNTTIWYQITRINEGDLSSVRRSKCQLRNLI